MTIYNTDLNTSGEKVNLSFFQSSEMLENMKYRESSMLHFYKSISQLNYVEQIIYQWGITYYLFRKIDTESLYSEKHGCELYVRELKMTFQIFNGLKPNDNSGHKTFCGKLLKFP